jgi:arginase
MHAGAVARVALDVAERVAAANADGRLALVLGGDCAVGIGSYLGVRRAHAEPWLLYLDPHPDLNTPRDNTSGALGWMGNAHLLGRPGTVPHLAGLDEGPALAPGRLILLDASPARSRPAERETIDALGIKVIAEADVAADPHKAAAGALAMIGNAPYALHFDSDCIDFADLPICENTDRNVGLAHQTAFQALSCAAAGTGLQAITVTQITPYHGAADGSTMHTFTHGLATALTSATASQSCTGKE